MSYVAKCALCSEALPYRRSETSILVRHLTEHHPEQQFSIVRSVKQQIHRDSPLEDLMDQNYKLSNKMTLPSPQPSKDVSKDSVQSHKRAVNRKLRTSSGRKADENLPDKSDFIARHPKGRKMYYKTTVASWRPARSRITCPSCGQSRLPTIRSTADRYTQSAYGAAWIMTCWPFCFLPCLFTAPTKHHMHCSHCNAYLGLYEPEREIIGINRNGGGHRKTGICSNEHFHRRKH